MDDINIRRLLEQHERNKAHLLTTVATLESYRQTSSSNSTLYPLVLYNRRYSENYVLPTAQLVCQDLSDMTYDMIEKTYRTSHQNSKTSVTKKDLKQDPRIQTRASRDCFKHRLPHLNAKPPVKRSSVSVRRDLEVKGSQLSSLPKIMHRDPMKFLHRSHDGVMRRGYESQIWKQPEPWQIQRAVMPNPPVVPMRDKIFWDHRVADRAWTESYEHELMKLQALSKVQHWLQENPVPEFKR